MSDFHAGMDARRPPLSYWCIVRGVYALEWADIQLRDNFTGKFFHWIWICWRKSMEIHKNSVRSPWKKEVKTSWKLFNSTHSISRHMMFQFERWFGLITIIGWWPETMAAMWNIGNRIWTMFECFRRTRNQCVESGNLSLLRLSNFTFKIY